MFKRKCVDPEILPLTEIQRIFKVTFLCLLSTLVAVWRGLYYCAIIPFAIFLTSVNYWKNPKYGIRRKIDIFVSGIGLIYNLYESSKSKYRILYIITCMGGLICYLIARKMPNPQKSVSWHIRLHIMANVGNIILYMGMKRR